MEFLTSAREVGTPDGMSIYFYRLDPPRPTFAMDMTPEEGVIMSHHAEYWIEQVNKGYVVAFGPVLDPAAVFGCAIIEADNRGEAQELGEADPAVTSGLATFLIFDMPNALARGVEPARQ
jgi:uncharacterized protein YciI